MSISLVYTLFARKRTSLAIFVLLLGTLTSQGAIWIGMTEKAALAELGKPQSSLKAGGKDIHFYEESRRIEIVNGVIQNLNGFPSSMIIEIEAPKTPVEVKNEHNAKSAFIDFTTAIKPSEQPFTLANPTTDKEAFMKFLDKSDPNVLYLMGGGLLAAIGLIIYFIYKLATQNRSLSDAAKQELVNSQLPPFLNAPPTKEPARTLTAPAQNPVPDVHSKRASLSIRERKHQDSDTSELPLKTLVKRSDDPSTSPVLSGADTGSSTKLKLRQD